MTKLSTIALALVLALGSACKKKDDAASKPGSAAPAPPVAPDAATAAPSPEAPAPSGDGLALAWKPAAVGSHEEVVDTQKSSFTLTPPGGEPVEIVMTKTRTYHVEVVEVAGDAVSKVKVHFASAKETGTMAGQPQDKALPIDGKAYVVWAEAGAVKATTDDGKEIPADELEAVADEFDDELGVVPSMPKVIGRRPWKQGEKVTLSPDDLAILNAANKDLQAQGGAITLVAVEPTTVTFEVELDAVKKDDAGEVKVPLRLTAKVDRASLHALALNGTGTLDGTVKGMAMKGTLEMTKTSTTR